MFTIELRSANPSESMKHNIRTAVRGVIRYGNKILMVHTKNGDYKFPGGGVKKGETHEETLLREIAEDTGYCDLTVRELAGTAVQGQMDDYEDNAYFEMTSYYYLCELNSLEQVRQYLDTYEQDLQFCGEFVTVKEAYQNNFALLQTDAKAQIDWLERETLALRNLLG